MKLNSDLNGIVAKCSGINFLSQKQSLYNILIQEHCRLMIWYDISTFFMSWFFVVFIGYFMFIFTVKFSNKKTFGFSLIL